MPDCGHPDEMLAEWEDGSEECLGCQIDELKARVEQLQEENEKIQHAAKQAQAILLCPVGTIQARMHFNDIAREHLDRVIGDE